VLNLLNQVQNDSKMIFYSLAGLVGGDNSKRAGDSSAGKAKRQALSQLAASKSATSAALRMLATAMWQV
jgi:hypothetical protein